MGLFFGIAAIVIGVFISLLFMFANGMSDAPSQSGISVSPPFIIGLIIGVFLIFTHYHHFNW